MRKLFKTSVLALAAALLALPAMAAAPQMPNVASAQLPPNTDYVSPADIHAEINNGGVQWARGDARHKNFFNTTVRPGGILGGDIERFDSILEFTFTGVGPLEGWSRTVAIPAKVETHTGPRDPKAPFQSFETVMYRVEGEIKGDKDFETLSIVAGSANGLDSPGHTTFYQQKDGSWLVDSHFNIKFVGTFKGAQGSKLDGLSDTFEGVITMVAVAPGTRNEDVRASK
jgi:hypothetical protein